MSAEPDAQRYAVVTGAAGGIGSAIIREFLRRGLVVHGLDRTPAARGERYFNHQVDLSDRAATDRALERVLAALPGRCEVLVNNAGVSRLQSFGETPDQLLDDLLEVNFIAAFRVTRALLPVLKAGSQPAIINVASELALVGQPGYSAYCGTKGALLAWSRALAVELAADGIRVNAVCPGPIDTPMLQAEFASATAPLLARQEEVASVPLGRLGKPEDIAAVVALLASPEAAFVTGAAWSVDGGKTAR
jgi:NAD(P)-dependent dehydrogenase (short-subunit alcohol dehydrogenase family)